MGKIIRFFNYDAALEHYEKAKMIVLINIK